MGASGTTDKELDGGTTRPQALPASVSGGDDESDENSTDESDENSTDSSRVENESTEKVEEVGEDSNADDEDSTDETENESDNKCPDCGFLVFSRVSSLMEHEHCSVNGSTLWSCSIM